MRKIRVSRNATALEMTRIFTSFFSSQPSFSWVEMLITVSFWMVGLWVEERVLLTVRVVALELTLLVELLEFREEASSLLKLFWSLFVLLLITLGIAPVSALFGGVFDCVEFRFSAFLVLLGSSFLTLLRFISISSCLIFCLFTGFVVLFVFSIVL